MIELFINGTIAKGQITLFGSEPLALTISANDILDISKKSAVHSQTFTVPADKNNNILFNHIFNIGSDASFDTRVKTECFILNDGIMVFNGNLQLTKINLKSRNVVSYDCVVYGEVMDLIKSIGDKLLTDLNFSNLDHTFNNANIMASWTADTDTLGYYYPLIDYGYDLDVTDLTAMIPDNSSWNGTTYATGGIDPFSFKPALSNKLVLDMIFSSANFSYESNFLNSDVFKQTIMPFNGETKLANNNAYTDQFLFYVGTSASEAFSVNQGGTPYYNKVYGELKNYQPVLDDNTTPFYDTAGDFNIATYKYIASESTVQSFVADVNVKFDAYTGTYIDGNGFVKINWYRKTIAGPTVHFYQDTLQLPNFKYLGTVYAVRSVTPKLNMPSSNVFYPVQAGEEIFFQIDVQASGYPWANQYSPQAYITTTIESATLYNNVYPDLVYGGMLFYNNFVPKNFKQVDFIKSIINMFNLVVIPDKNNPKKLKMEPRQDYYATGVIKDWTSKLDNNVKIDELFVNEKQNKKIRLTYKEDKDYYNVNYKSITNLVFGEYSTILDNEWLEGEKKIEVAFSPTPLDKVIGSTDVFVPKIAKRDEASGMYSRTDFNVRFLRKNSTLMTTQDDFRLLGESTINAYPYCGHLDHPTEPEKDYNFGQINYAYYPELTSMTPNNLVYDYWKDYIDDIKDKNSKLIKCKMYLTPNDIATFNYNDSIFVDGITDDGGHYFIVNKITYIPTSNLPSDVELIKVNRKPSENISRTSMATPLGLGPIKVLDLGAFNVINSDTTIVNGDNNVIGRGSSGSFIIGNNNTIAPDTKGVILINADNKFIDESFITIIGNTYFYPDGTFAILYNDIDSGVDTVLNPFATNPYNDIESGKDAVLNIGSSSPVKDIDSGIDEVI